MEPFSAMLVTLQRVLDTRNAYVSRKQAKVEALRGDLDNAERNLRDAYKASTAAADAIKSVEAARDAKM